MANDQNLLFGILALQSGAIGKEDLIEAIHDWSPDQRLGSILRQNQKLSAGQFQAIDLLVKAQIEVHGDAVSCLRRASIDNEFLETVSHQPDTSRIVDDLTSLLKRPEVANWENDSPAAKLPADVSQRFQAKRLHASGGLGRVFEAEDVQLNRVVALKDIKPRYANDSSSRARFV
ncbi:MAG: hypothetical protein AAF497_08915, partial [Planctomycetota bacterium]